MKSKIHRATLTSVDLNYSGSLTVDRHLMAEADLIENEEVHVLNVNNGSRLVTYVIPGPPGSGVMQLNGAAARHGMPGDIVIVIAYADVDDAELATFRPAVVHVDAANRVLPPHPTVR